MTAGPPAAVRLRRTRWTLTLLYTVTSAASLIALVFIATAIDARSASRALDSRVSGRALALSRAVWMDHGALHLEPLSEDELASASTVTVVLRRNGTGPVAVRWARPSAPSALPPASELDALWTSTVREQGPVLATAAGADGRRLRWAAAPVWDTDDVGAVVLTAVELAPLERQHAELVRSLIAGCAVLVLASAGAGHWLSGRSMRPALRALEQQERFLTEAAHELRTPLAALRLTLENGMTSAPTATADAVRLVDHLARLVTGLLSRARVQAGSLQVELTPLRLDQLVEQVVAELPHNGADITVRTEPTVVLGDPDLLAQAVRNLVENALRHGAPADGPPLVDVHVLAGRIAVRDHGPGIAAADREKVFGDRVTGGRDGSDGSDGVGVGLAIVRWVADLHGGTAEAVQAPGGGALVELVLPPHSPS
jgi:two-component system OmpR family sensor kinase